MNESSVLREDMATDGTWLCEQHTHLAERISPPDRLATSQSEFQSYFNWARTPGVVWVGGILFFALLTRMIAQDGMDSFLDIEQMFPAHNMKALHCDHVSHVHRLQLLASRPHRGQSNTMLRGLGRDVSMI